uniref:Uncharacterized protein n=1 Tax=Ciona intestinalis TaxID=7719 RepID=F6TZB4_CIOIN
MASAAQDHVCGRKGQLCGIPDIYHVIFRTTNNPLPPCHGKVCENTIFLVALPRVCLQTLKVNIRITR